MNTDTNPPLPVSVKAGRADLLPTRPADKFTSIEVWMITQQRIAEDAQCARSA